MFKAQAKALAAIQKNTIRQLVTSLVEELALQKDIQVNRTKIAALDLGNSWPTEWSFTILDLIKYKDIPLKLHVNFEMITELSEEFLDSLDQRTVAPEDAKGNNVPHDRIDWSNHFVSLIFPTVYTMKKKQRKYHSYYGGAYKQRVDRWYEQSPKDLEIKSGKNIADLYNLLVEEYAKYQNLLVSAEKQKKKAEEFTKQEQERKEQERIGEELERAANRTR